MPEQVAFTSFFNDQETEQDLLGFEPYVEALTDFLVDPLTKPPLTISIEGEWGVGKSSFLRQLKKSLENRKAHCKIEFNPWRYSQDEALWAAFAVEFEKQIIRQSHWKKVIKFFFFSLDWKKIGTDFLFFLIPLTVWGLLNVIPLTGLGPWLNAVSQGFLLATVLLGIYPFIDLVLQLQARIVKSVTSVDINKYFNERPDYKGKIPFLDKFHADLNRLAKVLAGDTRIYIFIDDLDRCQPGQAAELMQAINLMLGEHLQAIFIMAIDRKKIAAGIATDNEKYLDALCPNQEPIQFGFEYIDKFIQLPFLLPQPKSANIDELVLTLIKPQELSTELSKNPSLRPEMPISKSSVTPPPVKQEPESIRLYFEREVESISTIIEELSPVLQYNPRKIKKFLNIWRVQTHLGNRQGLFGFTPPNPNDLSRPITMYQFGKYLGLAYIWPDFVLDWWKCEPRKFLSDIVLAGEQYHQSDGIDQKYWDAFGSKHKLSPTQRLKYNACLKKSLAVPGLDKYDIINDYEPTKSINSIPLTKILTISPVYKEFDLSETGLEDSSNSKYEDIVKRVVVLEQEIQQDPKFKNLVIREIEGKPRYRRVHNLETGQTRDLHLLHLEHELKHSNLWSEDYEYHSDPDEEEKKDGQKQASERKDIEQARVEYRVRERLFDETPGTFDEQAVLFDDIGKVFERKNPQTGEWEELTEDELPSHPDWQAWMKARQNEAAEVLRESLSDANDEKDPLDMTLEEAYEVAPHDTDMILTEIENELNNLIATGELPYELKEHLAVIAYDDWRNNIPIEETKRKIDQAINQSRGMLSLNGVSQTTPPSNEVLDNEKAEPLVIGDPVKTPKKKSRKESSLDNQDSVNITVNSPRSSNASTKWQKKDPNYRVLAKHSSYAVEKIPGRPMFRILVHLPTGKKVTISRNESYEEDADLIFKKHRPDFDGK